MRVEDFPRPKDDNRRGVHWSASIYHPKGSALDFWMDELQALHIKWVKLLDDGGGSSLELCQRLIAAEIMPIVRLWRGEPNPSHIGGREEDTIRRLVGVGVRYFETNNQPDLPTEWQDGQMPSNWLDIVIDNFIIDADKVIGLGGLPAVPAMGVGSRDNPVELVMKKGRTDLFEKGAWVAIHNYTLNHPLDYPYDAVNQAGAPVSQADFDRLGSWAWEGRPREMINEWRASDKNPGDTLTNDADCFLAFQLMDEMIVKALGHSVPIISTEGGPVVGWKEDRRYPRIDPQTHAEWIVAINDFMQGNREIHGVRCPPSFFAMCHWLLGNYRLGFLSPGWESQAWYTDWWNGEFNLKGQMPVVAAVKAMPHRPVAKGGSGIISGQILRADSDAPLSDLAVKLMTADREAAVATTDTDGKFRLERLAQGTYDLSVIPWGVVRGGLKVANEPAPPMIIRLAGGHTSTLSGQLRAHDGSPQVGARVALRRSGVAAGEVTTGDDGSFRFTGLPMGSYQLRVPGITITGLALDGWGSKNLKLTAGSPSGYRYVVTKQRLLPPDENAGRRIFFGTVTDAVGKPLNDVRVQMSWQNAEPGTQFPIKATGHDPFKPAGCYEFVHTPGVFQLEATQGDWPATAAENLDTAHVSGREGQPISYEVSFQLQAVGSPTRVDGLVPGAPEGTLVKLIGLNRIMEARLAADATFVFNDLAPGNYKLEMPGVGILADDILLGPGALYRVVFPLRSKLVGQVKEAPEGLVAILYAPPPMNWTRQAPLDASGRFSFERLPPGRYRLEVADAILSDLEMTGENTLTLAPIDLMQGRKSVVRGRVADGVGKPQANVTIILRRSSAIVANMVTQADGVFRFVNLSPGTYTLEAAGMGEVVSGVVLDGQNELVRDILWIKAVLRGVIQGRLLASDGVPQTDMPVRILQDGEEVAATQSDREGVFRIAGLAAGGYDVTIGDRGATTVPAELADGATATLQLDLGQIPQKPLARYVLLGLPPALDDPEEKTRRTEQNLAAALYYIRQTGSAGGFSIPEAMQAEHVIIVGNQVPESAEARLRTAGCRVTRLVENGPALAATFQSLQETDLPS